MPIMLKICIDEITGYSQKKNGKNTHKINPLKKMYEKYDHARL